MAIKILHIITQLELGGAQKNVINILSHLDQEKFEIHLISSRGALDEEAENIPNIHLALLPFLKRELNPFFDLPALLYIIFYIKRNKIGVVYTHSSKAGILGRWAAKIAGVPVIIHTIHGWGFHDFLKTFLNDLYIFLEKVTAKITTRLVAVSEDDIRKGLEHGIGSPQQYLLIRCGIDRELLRAAGRTREELRYALGVRDAEQVVGMVACLKPQKNPIDFVKAASLILAKNPLTKFFLVGDGVLRSALEAEVQNRNLGGHFFMLGWRKDIDRVMPVFDVFVLTSLWEGLPVVLTEAMNFSTPIVAYDTSGIAEVVKDGVNGFLVRRKDVDGLAEKVGLLLENPERRQRMGQWGQHLVSNDAFQLSHMVRQFEQLYSESGV